MTTLKMLQKEFPDRVLTAVPLADISAKYLAISPRKAGDMANTGTLPLPAYRLGSQKSPWLVDLVDLAELIDTRKAEAVKLMKAAQVHDWPISRHKKKGTTKVP